VNWRDRLNYDPIRPLLESCDPAVVYFTRRDLLNEQVGPVTALWDLKLPQSLDRSRPFSHSGSE
jgi:hypothetical protein